MSHEANTIYAEAKQESMQEEQIKINEEAIEKFCTKLNEGCQFPKTFKELIDTENFGFGRREQLLREMGFGCAMCGRNITTNEIRFCGWGSDSRCKSCQYK